MINKPLFDWEGLKDQCYFVLKQKSDPLKYCNYSIPIPLPIGLPCMPCDLPNQYQLFKSNPSFQFNQEDVFLTFQESVGLWQRILIPASHRPWTMVGKDYYNHTPYLAFRDLNLCLSHSDRPQVRVFLNDHFVGRIIQTTVFNCCCWTQKYQEFEIYDADEQIIFKIVSRNPQRGHFIILPCWGFDQIKYEIIKPESGRQTLYDHEDEDAFIDGQVVGEITHLFNGFTEYTSKNDRYGIKLPSDASQQHKCLLLHCVLMIDYLLFQNF